MLKKRVSIIFSVIFLLFLAVPTIITIVDDTVDVSVVFSNAEEEEQMFQLINSCTKTSESQSAFANKKNNLGYYFKTYSKPHLNLIYPPPQLFIL